LPRVLSDADRSRYTQIFRLQEIGDLRAAQKHIKSLENDVLMGHVLAQKYLHPTAHRSRFNELRDWLALYADHPDAPRIHKLALLRRPENAPQPAKPTVGPAARLGQDGREPPIALPAKKRSKDAQARFSALQRQMRQRIRRGWPTGAREILDAAEYGKLAGSAEYDAYQARVAWSYYVHDKDELALAMAEKSGKRSRHFVPEADWVGGLAAWRLGRMEDAARHFEELAESPTASKWLRAGGAYWAARANLRLRRPDRVSYWLRIAAETPRTFYGLLGARALGQAPSLGWEAPPLTAEDLGSIKGVIALDRIIALSEIGQIERAEQEIRRLYPRATPATVKALIPIAVKLDLPGVQMGLSRRLAAHDDRPHDGGTFPLPRWTPETGFTVDRALIFGLVRQESGFKKTARSSQGARGVMQLMPATARFAAREAGVRDFDRRRLMEPAFNISLGQTYIHHLLQNDEVGDNLFFLLAAYNGGPGNLARWLVGTNFGDDPLLFIESIRSRETRFFIERVLCNYWLYRMRLGQATPSLDAVVSGLWPYYRRQEG
jgi:soluble lytic murein transglycosylase-like protein